MGKISRDSLAGKMTIRFLGLDAGILLLIILYIGSTQMPYPRFMVSNYIMHREENRLEELQDFVAENHISSSDSNKLGSWAEEKDGLSLIVSREGQVLFDSSYNGEMRETRKMPSGIIHSTAEMAFADGVADVYLYEEYIGRSFNAVLAASLIAGVFLCLLLFFSSMDDDIRYIRQLEKEVSVISNGDLTKKVTIQGKDELASLAFGLDRMRESLIEKEQKEREMRMAEEKLVLGMSHDLRNPLAGLTAYLEILKRQQIGSENAQFVEKSLKKTARIRALSDEMFEYFQVAFRKELALGKPETVQSVFGDYLSELYLFLKCRGFSVDADGLRWEPVSVRVNIDYIGRIFNNIMSNMEKYADKNAPVKMAMDYGENGVRLMLKNGILADVKTDAAGGLHGRKGGIGTKNIALMMEQMGGEMTTEKTDVAYTVTLFFPSIVSGGVPTSLLP